MVPLSGRRLRRIHSGIARLAALAIADDDHGGASLREIANASGGDVTVQVFPAATEIGVIVPAYLAGAAEEALLTRVFHPSLDDKAIKNAKLRMAEQLSLAGLQPDVFLRERMFSTIFADGPYRDSTFGTATTLESATLTDVQSFIADVSTGQRDGRERGLSSLNAFGAIATSSTSGGVKRSTPLVSPSALPHSTARKSLRRWRCRRTQRRR